MKGKELTYILGAGASYQSIPIVKTFSSRFNEFLLWIDKDIVRDKGFSPDEKQKFGVLLDLGKDLYNSFESHQSFDTYFKKLFHTGQKDIISQGKKILNLYFIWEHLSSVTSKPEKLDELTFWKQSIIDKRYDALIAGLLKPLAGKIEPYCKINFITWNYDLNLLLSLKNYFFPNGKISDFYRKVNKNNGTWIIDDKVTIINMNGYFYSSEVADLDSLKVRTIHDVIYARIRDENYFKITKTDPISRNQIINIDSDAELIKFAWETNDLNGEIAKSKIEESKNVVVIGYTFPLYNRLTDLFYLKQSSILQKTVIIQDPNAEKIRQNLLDYYQLSDSDALKKSLISLKDCDSFHIPSDIFGVSDGSGEYFFV